MEVLIGGPKALAPPWILVYSDFELFGKQDEIVKHLKKIQINDSFNVSVEDVLSLNASVIYLDSPNFTNDFVYKLIEKFTNRREDGSAFCIKNSQGENVDFLEMIPPGFKETDSTKRFKKYRNQLINTNHPTVYLRVVKIEFVFRLETPKKGLSPVTMSSIPTQATILLLVRTVILTRMIMHPSRNMI